MATLFILSAATCTQAAVSFVSDRASLGANDVVDWGQFPFTTYDPILVPGTKAYSAHGLEITLSTEGVGMGRANEGWGAGANFTIGDHLLTTRNGTASDMVFDFPDGIYGAGTQIASGVLGWFTGTIEAFGQNGDSLGLFDFVGHSNGLENNSAIFAGVLSDTPEIYRLRYTAFYITTDFLINQLSLKTQWTEPETVVPEPSTVIAGLLLLVPVAWGLKRKSPAKQAT